MKIKEFLIITEDDECIRIKGQFIIPNKIKIPKKMRKKKQYSQVWGGIALHNAKAGQEVKIRI